MFETLKNVFKVKEMRNVTVLSDWMIFIIRIGLPASCTGS